MSFSHRHELMLREMGVRLWLPPPVVEPTSAPPRESPVEPASVAVAAPSPASSPAPSLTPSGAQAIAPSATLGTLGWTELRQAVADCRACTLCETRKQTVFGVGHPAAPWMVVGEAPGEQEDLQGEPFVGAAGQLLDNMLRALQLTRSSEGDAAPERRVYIANTLKCRPPRNRNPEPQELARCEPFLQRQLQLLKPRIILAMGRFAVQALLRSNEPVGKLRGRVHHYQGIPLVVTYHPAYLLRNLPDKARAWEDLCLAAATFKASPCPPDADEQHTAAATPAG
jgi:uracil-DNA glycosylase